MNITVIVGQIIWFLGAKEIVQCLVLHNLKNVTDFSNSLVEFNVSGYVIFWNNSEAVFSSLGKWG